MENKYLYPFGLPFSRQLGENLKVQVGRIKKQFPTVILVDGGQGKGKTTLMTQMIDYINSLYDLPECKLDIKEHPQLALGGAEFMKNFNICKKEGLPVIGYDESGDYSKKGAMSRFNAALNRRFETMRSSNIIVILCLPSSMVLDNHLFVLEVVRGLVHIDTRSNNYSNFRAYSLGQLLWCRYWFDKLVAPKKHECYNHAIPSFVGHSKPLPPERAKKLAALSDKGKDEANERADIQLSGLVPYEELQQKTGRSLIWVKKKVASLRINPVRTIKRKKYFHKSIIDILLDEISKGRQGNFK